MDAIETYRQRKDASQFPILERVARVRACYDQWRRENPAASINNLAKLLGEKRQTIQNLLYISRLDPTILSAFEAGTIDFTRLRIIAMQGRDRPELQHGLLAVVTSYHQVHGAHITERDLATLARSLKTAPRPARNVPEQDG